MFDFGIFRVSEVGGGKVRLWQVVFRDGERMLLAKPKTAVDRAFTATVTRVDGSKATITIYGPNMSAAEERFEEEHPGESAVVRREVQ